jgi:hypothetical protein
MSIHILINSARAFLSNQKPEYSGMSYIEIKISDIKNRFPKINELVGNGMVMALSDGIGMMIQQNGDGSARCGLCLRAPEDWVKTCGIDFTSPKAARESLLALYGDWSEGLKDFIRSCDDEIIPRALYQLPLGFKWEHKTGVTIIGDAAHVSLLFNFNTNCK